RVAHTKVLDRLARLRNEIWRDHIRSDWGRPTTRLELVPRPGVSITKAQQASQTLARRSVLPPARPLAAFDDLGLRLLDRHAPRTADDVPQRAELLGLQSNGGDPFVASSLFEVVEVVASPTVKRQSGRFVLPVSLRVAGNAEGFRKASRRAIHNGLAALPLPAGTDLELPELNPAIWDEDRLRLLAIASALPLLLLALAITRLSSVSIGLTTLAPVVLGVAAAAPWIQATRGQVDEMTLLAIAMALAGTFPLALEAAAAAGEARAPRLSGGILFRWLARRAPGVAGAVLALACFLMIPGLGLDTDRHPWVLPLRAAAVTATALFLAAYLWLPILLHTARELRQRDRRAERERAVPPAWQQSERLSFEVRRVAKIYGNGFQALHGVSFHLQPGIVGLLGPNGAGKTTLLRLLCGLLEPTRGQVRFQGVPLEPVNLPEYRRLVGFLPQGFNAYEGFTGAQFLDYWAIERGFRDPTTRRREVERVLSDVGLQEAANRKVREFSGGMRRRIGIARALLGEPPIVIVDEPTTGLDVESRNRLRETLLAVAGERIIIFSTHIASDVAAAASRILLLNRGRLVFDGPSSGLIERAHGKVFEALIEDHDLRDFSARYRVTTRVRTLEGLRVRAVAHGDQPPAGDIVEPNLEEAYLALIGAPSRQGEDEREHGGSLLDLERWDSRLQAGRVRG
ncbi:MAG: ABC transporter ATP-binding protein, partial [Acidobacteriota bacterium]